jgi:hypothetical protein
MPRIRLDPPELGRSTDATGGDDQTSRAAARDDAFARIDTEVFQVLSGTYGLEKCGLRPRIDRWMECWSGV